MFISPLDDDIVKGLYGDRKNIANTAALLKAVLDIPPEEEDQLRQIITVVITKHVMLPEEEDYMNTYELRNRKTGRLFTDLQQYVILELPKLPEENDGRPLWPQLRFLKCRAKEEMAMVAEKHPEVRPLVAEYKRMTLVEKLRKRAEYREKQRRDEWAALEYAKDEGRAESQQALAEQARTIADLRRKLREAGIDPR
jgi:predicted transposase/invertase (TIGR01784 family)